MKLWKPSTARISQKMPLISAHHSARRRAPRAAADSSIAAPARASSVSNANSSAIYSSLLRDRFDDHEGLRPGVVVGQRNMDMRDVAFGGPRVKRSDARRVGKESVRTCRSWWSPHYSNKNNKTNTKPETKT